MTHTRVLQIWFAAVASTVLGVLSLDVSVMPGMGTMLLVLSLVPAAIVLKVWSGVQPRTAADLLYDRNRPA